MAGNSVERIGCGRGSRANVGSAGKLGKGKVYGGTLKSQIWVFSRRGLALGHTHIGPFIRWGHTYSVGTHLFGGDTPAAEISISGISGRDTPIVAYCVDTLGKGTHGHVGEGDTGIGEGDTGVCGLSRRRLRGGHTPAGCRRGTNPACSKRSEALWHGFADAAYLGGIRRAGTHPGRSL